MLIIDYDLLERTLIYVSDFSDYKSVFRKLELNNSNAGDGD